MLAVMPAKKHNLSEINEEQRVAICSHCGATGIHRHRSGWKCNPPDTPEYRARRRQYTRKYREQHPERVREATRQWAEARANEPRVLSDHLCECGCGKYTYLAVNADKKKGRVKGEPLAYRHGHNPVKHHGILITKRYVEEDRGYFTPCWIWLLKIDHNGYPKEKGEIGDSAHRNYYRRFKSPIPEKYDVDHMCCQRACVNPDHLQAVTRGENLWRMFMVKAGLTPQQITELRQWVENHLTSEQVGNIWSVYDAKR